MNPAPLLEVDSLIPTIKGAPEGLALGRCANRPEGNGRNASTMEVGTRPRISDCSGPSFTGTEATAGHDVVAHEACCAVRRGVDLNADAVVQSGDPTDLLQAFHGGGSGVARAGSGS